MSDQNDVFKAFEADLQNLKPLIREQVLIMAQQLINDQDYDPPTALLEATRQVELRFLDEEG